MILGYVFLNSTFSINALLIYLVQFLFLFNYLKKLRCFKITYFQVQIFCQEFQHQSTNPKALHWSNCFDLYIYLSNQLFHTRLFLMEKKLYVVHS